MVPDAKNDTLKGSLDEEERDGVHALASKKHFGLRSRHPVVCQK